MYWVVRAFFRVSSPVALGFQLRTLFGVLRVRIGLGTFFQAWFFSGFLFLGLPWSFFRPRMLWRLSPLSVSSPPSHASSFACASLALARLGGGVSRGRVWVMRVRMYRPLCVFGRYYPLQILVNPRTLATVRFLSFRRPYLLSRWQTALRTAGGRVANNHLAKYELPGPNRSPSTACAICDFGEIVRSRAATPW